MYYIQRERNIDTTIEKDAIVQFDTPISLSATEAQPDFRYNIDGSIDILRTGVFVVQWFVSQMTGLATDGQIFVLKKYDYSASPQGWVSIAGGSSHLKTSSSCGFGTIDVSETDIDTYGMATVALFNSSETAAKLTNVPHAKAGILVDGIDSYALAQDITNIRNEISQIQLSLEISDVRTRMSTTSMMMGLGASAISIGPTFNFWGVGTLTSNQSWTQTNIYLVTPAQFPELAWYQGDPTIGTVWFSSGGTGVPQAVPIYIDHTGIYIRPANQINVNAGTTFKFTQALILVDSAASAPSP